MSIVLTNANLIDAVHPVVTGDASVVIDDDRIVHIDTGPPSSIGGDVQVIDLRGAYLLPGLWDVHIHPDYPVPPAQPPPRRPPTSAGSFR